MVRFYESTFSHSYPFPAVTLAYFLRYPNPFSTHVLATDVLDRSFDAQTQTLYTARLHLKKSKVPSALYRLLPKSLLGPVAASSPDGTTQSYVLERSIVDIRSGVMVTESRNLELTGVLEVAERQLFRRPGTDMHAFARAYAPPSGFELELPRAGWSTATTTAAEDTTDVRTDVSTKVELYSRLGAVRERMARARADRAAAAAAASEQVVEEPKPARVGFLRSWSTSAIQKSIESLGLQRTERAIPNSKRGLEVVLERLRTGGVVAVMEGMKRDREEGGAIA